MSAIDIIVLRHLRVHPAHGYELRKRVEATTDFVLHNNSLYPALRRFEEAGAVVKVAESQEGRPARNVYHITDVGRELLHDLLADFPPELAGDEMEFLARVGQFVLLEPEERLAILDTRDAALAARILHLGSLVDKTGSDPWSRDVVVESIRRAAAERDWIVELRARAAQDDAP
jgi:DNA-binding PadR family transcriptional regulator